MSPQRTVSSPKKVTKKAMGGTCDRMDAKRLSVLLRILKLSYGVDPEAVGVGMKAKVGG